ncbi:MAG: sulfatase-like hydrolase/transferase [Rhizobiaceae bacterium]
MANAKKNNVLFVSVDQWPGHLLGIAGRRDIDTPTLDQLARNGVRFTNCISECPICIPARRSMMTGTDPRTHGDRVFTPDMTMPDLPWLAETFRNAGYQTGAVGKLHVYPSRNRIGFEELVSFEEGRPQLGGPDDWELFLADHGEAGNGYAHGMSNNGYEFRPWHLSEAQHPTNWLSRQMCRMIQRRDPTRPQFWHLSFNFPHPPIVPIAAYFDAYRGRSMDAPLLADWAKDPDAVPPALQKIRRNWPELTSEKIMNMRRAFHAQCTQIDHQLRRVIGTLREHLLLDDTIILFTSDHGDMLGDNGLYAKRLMYRGSAHVPMIIMGPKGDKATAPGKVDDRLVGMQDIMPTLLEMANIDIPDGCTGRSMISGARREYFYAEAMEDTGATRMLTDGKMKLIWYPAGNHIQLFDMENDPEELRDLSELSDFESELNRMEKHLIDHLYGIDLEWVHDGKLRGFTPPDLPPAENRGLSAQRGLHYPEPPKGDFSKVVGAP